MKRLKVVLLAVAFGVVTIAAVSSPGMARIGVAQPQPFSVTPTYQELAHANASDMEEAFC